VYDNAIPLDLCDEFIRRFDLSQQVKEGAVQTEDGQLQPEFRSCLELNISKQEEFKDLQAVIMKLAELAVGKYQKDIHNFIFPNEIGCEQFRMKKYRCDPEKNDHFSYHVDVNNYASARRFLVLFWYLNDVEKGGETLFPGPNIRVKPVKGRLLIFPPFWMYPHSGERPISNDKYLLGSYLHMI
jgi:prolyl 4-hydroxylase